jgi:hypothetical protein
MTIQGARNIGIAAICCLLAGRWAAPASAQEGAVCAPPISVCQPLSARPDIAGGCPDGYQCTCVPSCPNCRDCAVRVCVPASAPECRTACDCEPGLGCFDNRCLAGFAPVYCCEGDKCPAGQQCQHENGERDTCAGAPECRTACDCEPGLGCFEGQCIAGVDPVYCCESDRCPAGEACQHRSGERDVCRKAECRTACDCEPGLGCFEGQCLAGIVPVFCCEGDQCPAGDQCQHRDGRMDRCEQSCVEQAWLCSDDPNDPNRGCGDGRICSCTASCPQCEDCGPNVCIPPDQPTPYRCDDDGGCAQPGDRCICVSSCPACDDCALSVCVPGCDDPMCEKRRRASSRKINRVVEKTRPCRDDADCVRIDTSTECRGTCGAWINSMYAARVENFIDHVDRRYCDGYQEDGCPYTTPRCVNETGQCIRGACTGVPVDTAVRSSSIR